MPLNRCMYFLRRLLTSALLTVYACTAVIFLLGVASSVTAAGVPAAAINKTITISFVATGNATNAEGQTHPFSTSHTRIIYVSSAGRIFARHFAASMGGGKGRRGRISRGADFAPGDERPAQGHFQFQGNKLIGVIPWKMGARQFTISFDDGFTSCTLSIIDGHTAGAGIMRRGPSGVMHEITSAETSSLSCSIQSGNAFAN
jgi:hypothetical protein